MSAGDLGTFRGGSGFPVRYQGQKSGELPFFKVSDMNNDGNELFMSRANNYISEAQRKTLGAVRVPAQAIVFAKVGAAVFLERKRILTQDSCIDNNMAAFIVDKSKIDVRFAHYLLTAFALSDLVAVGALPSLNGRQLRSIPLLVPTDLAEQRRIVATLADADELISTIERLIAKKRAIKQGMMQQLLAGRTRLPGFHGRWSTIRLSDLLIPRAERPIDGQELEVLSCSKHLGFVRSLDYFKNQVFSRDLSSYKVIRRGDIGYPANHIEEGSIGVQEEFEAALVSPIYVVLSPLPGVDSYFLQRQLKLDTYRQVFAKATNASVDRRGSLRWPEFSQIEVLMPEEQEQRAVAAVLRSLDSELSLIGKRLDKARAIKAGMMQQLLTGHTRLSVEASV